MLLGRDVVERFQDAQAALVSCESCRGAKYGAYASQPWYPLPFNELR